MLVVENLCRSQEYESVVYNYSYRIIKDKISFEEYNNVEMQSYGIEVERQDVVNNKIVNIEREQIKFISPYKEKVYNLNKMLCDNIVSPLHLLDTVGEYIDEYISDFDEVLTDIYV